MLPGGCEVQAEQPSDPSGLPRQVQTLVMTRLRTARPRPREADDVTALNRRLYAHSLEVDGSRTVTALRYQLRHSAMLGEGMFQGVHMQPIGYRGAPHSQASQHPRGFAITSGRRWRALVLLSLLAACADDGTIPKTEPATIDVVLSGFAMDGGVPLVGWTVSGVVMPMPADCTSYKIMAGPDSTTVGPTGAYALKVSIPSKTASCVRVDVGHEVPVDSSQYEPGTAIPTYAAVGRLEAIWYCAPPKPCERTGPIVVHG